MNHFNNKDNQNNTNSIEEIGNNSSNKEQNENQSEYQDTKNEKYLSKSKKNILFYLIILFLIAGFIFFILLGFFSTGFYSAMENYEEYEEYEELINKGGNEGYIFEERANISYFSNIHKVENNYSPIIEKDTYNYKSKVKDLEPYLYRNQHIEPLLIQHGVSSYMTEKGTEPLSVKIINPKNKPVVCVQDWFNDGDNHGESIAAYIQSLYDGPIYLIDNNTIGFNTFSELDFYKNCDIVNMSIGYSKLMREKNFLNNFGDVLKEKETIFIYAAGNDYFEDSEDSQRLTHFKNKIKESDKTKYDDIKGSIPNYFISVTQGLVSDNEYDDSAYRIYSGGEGVDLIVLNGDVYIDYTKLSGTSFSTPVATAMAANLLTAGVPKSKVLDYLKSDYVLTDEQQIEYPILLVDDIQNKVNNLKFK